MVLSLPFLPLSFVPRTLILTPSLFFPMILYAPQWLGFVRFVCLSLILPLNYIPLLKSLGLVRFVIESVALPFLFAAALQTLARILFPRL